MTAGGTIPIPSDQWFHLKYTARDVMLYAVAVGLGGDPEYAESDLAFVYEDVSPALRVVPTWVATWPFWATRAVPPASLALGQLPKFPPPAMAGEVLPRHCLVDSNDATVLADFPMLHTQQSILWHVTSDNLPTEGSFRLRRHVVSVAPKAVGTFVTTQFDIFETASTRGGQPSSQPVVTIQLTVLILGLGSDRVRFWQTQGTESLLPGIPPRITARPTVRQKIVVAPNQALLYRLVSGDANAIHVDPSANPLQHDDDAEDEADEACPPKCILHGLATLGLVARVVLQRYPARSWHSLQARFRAPVFVGDTLEVDLWEAFLEEKQSCLYFCVRVVGSKTVGPWANCLFGPAASKKSVVGVG